MIQQAKKRGGENKNESILLGEKHKHKQSNKKSKSAFTPFLLQLYSSAKLLSSEWYIILTKLRKKYFCPHFTD